MTLNRHLTCVFGLPDVTIKLTKNGYAIWKNLGFRSPRQKSDKSHIGRPTAFPAVDFIYTFKTINRLKGMVKWHCP